MPSYTSGNSPAQTDESPSRASRSDSSKMVRCHGLLTQTETNPAGMDMSAIREIKYLQELRHENITEVRGLLSLSLPR